jgi:hypothetical protein
MVSFNFQSNINFNDWISNLTLCLAPLFVHLLAGVPSPVYLCRNRPRWHDYLGHLNPTSIIWRYFAVADRRARTKSGFWTPISMAASNTLFWTSTGWDGEEHMITESVSSLARQPRGTHMQLLSLSAMKTVVVTFQGVQAIHALFLGVSDGNSFADTVSIGTIFFPLATFGLLRLPAAFWLTDTEHYWSEDGNKPSNSHGYESVLTRSWQGVVVRAFFLLVTFLLFSVGVASLVPRSSTIYSYLTLTELIMGLFYIMFLSVTSSTLAFYILFRHTNTTVIPCINRLWYKIYTAAFYAMMALLFIIAALETRKAPCGALTTSLPDFDANRGRCGNSTYVFPMNSPKRNTSALPWNTPVNRMNSSEWNDWTPAFGAIWRMPNGTYEVIVFEGWCQLGAWQSTGYFDLMTGNFSAR